MVEKPDSLRLLRKGILHLGHGDSEPGATREAGGGDMATENEDGDAHLGSAPRRRTAPDSDSLSG